MLAEAQERHASDLRELAAKHELAMSTIQEEHTSTLAELQSLQKSRQDTQETDGARHQQALAGLIVAHEAALASMANSHAAELAAAKAGFAHELDQRQRDADSRLAAQAESHNEALTELRKVRIAPTALEDDHADESTYPFRHPFLHRSSKTSSASMPPPLHRSKKHIKKKCLKPRQLTLFGSPLCGKNGTNRKRP